MRKFEYKVYRVSDAYWATSVEHDFGNLGKAGWRLISVDEGIAYFVRPLEGE